jgi:hypothetical protein
VRPLYRERSYLVAHLAALYPSVITFDGSTAARPVVFVHTSAGQIAWRIDVQDLDLFPHVPVVNPADPRAQWDGHRLDEKHARLTRLTQIVAAEQLDLTGLHIQVDDDPTEERAEERAALFDAHPDRAIYRYMLERHWDRTRPMALWVMLNPSTATAMQDDTTIRRVRQFSQDTGAGGFQVLNLFALRATDPTALTRHPSPVGEDNDTVIHWFARHHTGPVIVAWGAHGQDFPDRVDHVLNLLGDQPLFCLGVTKDDHPRHPARLDATAELEPYVPAGWIPAPRRPDSPIVAPAALSRAGRLDG